MSLLRGAMAINNARQKDNKKQKKKTDREGTVTYSVEPISMVGLMYIQRMRKKKEKSYEKTCEDFSCSV